uniref:Phage SPO1 DNA polymerase-related protein n=2 Tax=Candidatus Bipolaricaulota TaxID=67810 RepID=H5SMZ1_9BACT|nr:phage SPO1 DNA polymerase-related protein [uncultured Acetothermia bacterium]BAL57527.1 phage SPO1 DNA polymerase-related protein [uncultured Acetothermia bacterium]BAL59003.1 hypothetical protein HGMM_OP3C158 [Candidatus Acetothermum autotrophicum]
MAQMRSLFDEPSEPQRILTFEEAQQQAQTCTKCRLHQSRTTVVFGEGNTQSPVIFIGEGPGEVEDSTGRPFVGPAGQKLTEILQSVGIARESVYITNMVKCFISPRVLIYTSQGYKPIKDIRMGDLVLTHRGRFRRVVYVRPQEVLPKGSPVVRLTLRALSGNARPVKITVTPEHPFLVNGQWKRAADIRPHEKVQALGDRCEVCGQTYFVRYDRYETRTYHTCSYRCHNRRIFHDPHVRERIREAMLQQYGSGIRDGFTITARAHERVRQLVAAGMAKVQHFTPEERHRSRVVLAARVTEGKAKHRSGFGEQELCGILDELGVKYIHHFAFAGSPWIYDFCLPDHRILIEVLGPGMNNHAAQGRALLRQRLAAEQGYLVVNLWWHQIMEHPATVAEILRRILRNHEGEYVFVEVEVAHVEHLRTRAPFRLYNIGVEEDESYIVDGIVSHNCRPPGNRAPQKDEIDACWPYLEAQIRHIKPKIIVALGNIPAQYLLKTTEGITTLRGRFFPWRDGIEIYCMFHPSYLLRNPSREPGSPKYLTWQDIKKLKERLDGLL